MTKYQETSTAAIAIALLLTIALSTFATPALAFVSTAPSISATILNYEPVPATPGSLLDVYVQLQNTGNTAGKVQVMFVDNAPFSIDTENDRIKSVDTLPSQQSFLLKYKVRVRQDAAPGTNYLKLTWRTGDSASEQSALLPIEITGNTVSLSIDNVKLSPETFTPGTKGDVTFSLHNDAQLPITAGAVKLDLSSVDLVPIGGTNQQRFTDLQPGETLQMRFTLAPTPSIAPGVYKVPVTINFTDQTGASYSQSEYIGIIVGATPDVSVSIDDSKLTTKETQGDVTLRITNKGLSEIKFVNLKFGESSDYEIVMGGDERYVGNVDSDDYKTARITVLAKGDSVTMPVTVTYMDALNTPYTKTLQLKVPVTPASGGSGMTTVVVIVVLVLLVGGYFLLRRKGKDRK
jgi:hypothetical protein